MQEGIMLWGHIYNNSDVWERVPAVIFSLGGLFFLGFILSVVSFNLFIHYGKGLFCSDARALTPDHHQLKNGTPSMGGLVIIALSFLLLLPMLENNIRIGLFLLTLLIFGSIGGLDDFYKLRHKKGMSARLKFILQLIGAATIALLLLKKGGVSTVVTLPLFSSYSWDLGLLYIPWAMFILIGCSNAVNLTDGLDGLAMSSLVLNFGTLGLLTIFNGITHLPSLGTAFSIAPAPVVMTSVGLGFLWYNTYPAQIIMGDIGALSLGAALAVFALITKQELWLAIIGALFVVETVSVMLQVSSFKLCKKRIFKMAPLHHHFELNGWKESHVTMRFTLITFLLCMFAILTTCLR